MESSEIRKLFLAYFNAKDHATVPSSSLVPAGDQTLLFSNAGMVQFKDVFLGERKVGYKRAVSSQKCMRVSGKHNDLENVGYTSRHHTFFEMLGNFSFGDYFKSEACAFAWEFLTEAVEINPEKLWITIFEEDDEAEAVWRDEVGIDPQRIVRCGEKDNFWSMGPVGPCGPCSEIHLDRGEKLNPNSTNPGNDETGERFMEVWNLVFMQYNRDESGKQTPLPRPSIDTGMGLERLAAVLQGAETNYDTDLFLPIIRSVAEKAGVKYGKDAETDASLRVVADHARAGAFLIGDGVVPENEGRGYVLRRILRRAIRHGRRLGFDKPFLHESCVKVVEGMAIAYPELVMLKDYLRDVVENEERNFLTTIDRGMGLLEEEAAQVKKNQSKRLDGEVAFKLYDTFGFPLDLTQVILEEKGIEVDEAGFEKAMERQREKSRKGSKLGKSDANRALYEKISEEGFETEFVGNDKMESGETIAHLIVAGESVREASAGTEAEALFASTPFYAESGGQVADTGRIVGPEGKAEVGDVQRSLPNLWTHKIKVTEGTLKVGDSVRLMVTESNRRLIMAHHSATHLLHQALKDRLGSHVKQAGSLVDSHHLRFDFNHMSALSDGDIEEIEKAINDRIRADLEVDKREMAFDEALKTGAAALFGEKYGDRVRVVSMGEYSKELCGGTHVARTGEIGSFWVTKEEAVAAGVRRIEAVSGAAALDKMHSQRRLMRDIGKAVGVPPDQIGQQVETLRSRLKELEKENKKLRTEGGAASVDDLLASAVKKDGYTYLIAEIEAGGDREVFRELGDRIREKLSDGVMLLAAQAGEKYQLLAMVSKAASDKFKAGQLMKEVTAAAGGSGGGRPDRAEGGVPDKTALEKAFEKMEQLVG